MTLCEALSQARVSGSNIYLCGNGGSAANAMHIANDLSYVDGSTGLKSEALTSNISVVTCLANDVSYDDIFSAQLKVKANPGDILIALSGSGNSRNVVNALDVGNQLGMQTFAILGYSGGESKSSAKYPIHFQINDMQISEDLQLVVGHICMKYLSNKAQAEKA